MGRREEGRGWYEGADYANARLESPLPHVVSGVWEPSIRTLAGSGGVDVRWSFVSVDPDFHHGHEGIVLLDQAGTFRGTVSVDTTQLGNGWHRLFVRADAPCDGSSGNNCGSGRNVSVNSGVLVVWFFVHNHGG